MDPKKLIPEHQEGIKTDTEATAEFETEKEAREFFLVTKDRLLNVNGWHELAGLATASFQLTDSNGEEVQRSVLPGDHFKISVPAPGSLTGDGYDWVRVESVTEDEDDMVIIRVRPSSNPRNDDKEVAHFFDEAATSSFVVKREFNKVTAAVHGRNEKPNTSEGKIVDQLRNAAVAAGAISGFSKLQWKSLVNGLVRKK